jgi:alpha-1,2-mannosyltransferase
VTAPASGVRTAAEERVLHGLRQRRTVLLVAVPLLVVSLAALAVLTGGRFIDLEVYRFGVRAWLDGGDMYGQLPPTTDGITLPFIYPPFAALLMVPLAVVPLAVAAVALFALSVSALGLTLWVFARRLWPSSGRGGALAVTALTLPFALWLEPVRATFEFGQVNLLLMALVAADCLVRRPPWPRGLLIGIAAAIKLTPAAFVLFLLLRRDVRATVTAAVSGAVVTLAAFAVAPGASLRFWLGNPAGGVSGSPFYTNQTFQAVLVRAGVDGTARTVLWVLLSAGLLALAVPVIRRAPAPLALAVTAGVALLVSPTSWSHHWVWVAPAILVAGVTAWRARSAWWAAACAAMSVLFVVAPHNLGLPRAGERELAWTPLQQVVGSTYVWFAVLLLLVLHVVVRRRQRVRR